MLRGSRRRREASSWELIEDICRQDSVDKTGFYATTISTLAPYFTADTGVEVVAIVW